MIFFFLLNLLIFSELTTTDCVAENNKHCTCTGETDDTCACDNGYAYETQQKECLLKTDGGFTCANIAASDKADTCCDTTANKNCATCGTATNAQNCATCNGGYAFDTTTNECLDKAAGGFTCANIAASDKTGTCCDTTANKNCATCGTTTNAQNCATCINGYAFDTTKNECLEKAAGGLTCANIAASDKADTCCDTTANKNCATCGTATNAQNCATCINGYAFDTTTNECLEKAAGGFTCANLGTNSDKEGTCCEDASLYCATCLTGGDALKCHTCLNTEDYTYDENQKTCTLKEGIDCSNPTGDMADTCCANDNALNCGKCGVGDNAGKCITCIDNSFAYDSEARTCTAKSQGGFTCSNLITTNDKQGTCCENSDLGCATCSTGSDNLKCATCIDNTYVYDSEAKTCTAKSQGGFTCSKLTSDTDKEGTCCEDASLYCATCLTEADALKCHTCLNTEDYTYDENQKTCTLKESGTDCLTATGDLTGTCCANNNILNCGKCGIGANAVKCATCKSDEYIFDKVALTCTKKAESVVCADLTESNKAGTCCEDASLYCATCGSSTDATKCATCLNADDYTYDDTKKTCTLKEGIDCSTATGDLAGTCCANNNALNCGKCGTGTNAAKCVSCLSDEYTFDKVSLTCKPKSVKPGACLSSIKNCIRCDENDETKCTACNTTYELKDGKCELELARCDQSAIDRGCSLCYLYDTTVCKECDEDRYFSKDPNPETNKCECENPDHNITGGVCTVLTVECKWGDSTPIIGCTACHSRNPSKCQECDRQNGFIFNIVTNSCDCEHEGYDIVGQKCTIPETSGCNKTAEQLIGCIKCAADDQNKCNICDEAKDLIESNGACKCKKNNYELNAQGICAPPAESNCNSSTIVPGCIKCANDPNTCSACDEGLNFGPSPTEGGKCGCLDGYILRLDGKCSDEKYDGSVKAPYEQLEEKALDDGCLTCLVPSEEDGVKILTVNTKDLKYNDIKLYTTEVSDSIGKVSVTENHYKNVLLKVDNRNDNNPLIVDVKQGQEITLDTTGKKLPLKLPKESENVDIDCNKGDSTLTIDADGDGNQVKIGDVVLSDESNLVFKPLTSLNLNVLDLFDSSTINIQKDPESEAKVTVTTVKVEQGSTPTLQNLEINKELNMAPNTQLNLDNTVTFSNAKFNIYRNISQSLQDTYFKFSSAITEIPNGILIKNRQRDILLDDQNDKVILVHAPAADFNETICKGWASKVSNDGDYRGGKCILNDPDNSGDNSVYAYKAERDGGKKKKLSAGAIAGIVIACVVVVAAIIALLVYFLVIKKKNQSTTSTQGDSSIAI